VQGHPNPKLRELLVKGVLRGDSRLRGVIHVSKHGAERIPYGLEDIAMILCNRIAEEEIVASQCLSHGLRMLFPEAGTTLYIGEEEGEGCRRVIGHQDCLTGSPSAGCVIARAHRSGQPPAGKQSNLGQRVGTPLRGEELILLIACCCAI
jgi:hypothetical protein